MEAESFDGHKLKKAILPGGFEPPGGLKINLRKVSGLDEAQGRKPSEGFYLFEDAVVFASSAVVLLLTKATNENLCPS